jgi:hypothetical protein
MSKHGTGTNYVVVMGNKGGAFSLAVVAVDRSHGQAGDIQQWPSDPLPLELANELATADGRRRGLPVVTWPIPDVARQTGNRRT